MYNVPNKKFTELTLEDCMNLHTFLKWEITYADGKFAGMRIEKDLLQ